MSRRGVTLTEAAREFARHPSPWVLGVAFIASLTARLAVGDWRLSDALLPLLMLAGFPFLEWTMHVVVLHWRPRRVAGVMVDPMLARKHREHHLDPKVIPLIFIPVPSLIGAVVSALIIGLLIIPRTALGLTFLMVTFGIGVAYEWTHYLVHTDYKPKTVVYRAIWRNHRLHHFKNEHYWFAVTSPGTADRVLGTHPDPQTVPTSPTARNLYAEDPV